jgi:hypothetical protein
MELPFELRKEILRGIDLLKFDYITVEGKSRCVAGNGNIA